MRTRRAVWLHLTTIVAITTVLMAIATRYGKADQLPDYVEEGAAPLNCSVLQHISRVRTYSVQQLGGGASIPFTATDLHLFEFNTINPSIAWYKPNAIETWQNGVTYEWIDSGVEVACRQYNIPGVGVLYAAFYLSHRGHAVITSLRAPRPRFSMSTSSQQSGDGGTLTLSAGHSVALQSTTTDFGSPAAPAADLVWIRDQTQLATGPSTSFVPEYGTHTVTLSLINQAGQGEASATLVVVPPDEAGSCDDPLTDVVETNCNGEGDGGSYGVGGGSSNGTRYCWVLDWYDWNSFTQRYEYWYSQEVYCWYAE